MKQLNKNTSKLEGDDHKPRTMSAKNASLKQKKKYECPECSFSSNLRKGINHHRSTKHKLAPIPPEPPQTSPCQYCDKVLSTVSARKKHVRQKHPEKLSQALRCEICFDIFVTSSSLKHHITIFHGEKPYARKKKLCNICGDEVSSVKAHLKSHVLEKHKKEQAEKNPMPFSCKHCKWYKDRITVSDAWIFYV